MTALPTLAQRLEEATGPDRELNAAIAVAVNWSGYFGSPDDDGYPPPGYGSWIQGSKEEARKGGVWPDRVYATNDRGDYITIMPAAFTGDTDAAERLLLHCFPRADYGFESTSSGGRIAWVRDVSCMSVLSYSNPGAPCPPNTAIALCLATIRALIAQGGKDTTNA